MNLLKKHLVNMIAKKHAPVYQSFEVVRQMVWMDSKRVKIIVRIGTEYPAPLRKSALLAEAARPLR